MDKYNVAKRAMNKRGRHNNAGVAAKCNVVKHGGVNDDGNMAECSMAPIMTELNMAK